MDSTIVGWLVGGLCILLNLAVTTTLTILIKRWFERRDKHEAEQAAEHARLATLEKEQEQQRMQQLMDARCDIQVQAIRTEIQPLVERLGAIEDGSLSGLRNDLLNNFYRCRDWQKFRTDWDTQNMEDLYKSYHRLHGNSFIDHLMEEFYKIPLQ